MVLWAYSILTLTHLRSERMAFIHVLELDPVPETFPCQTRTGAKGRKLHTSAQINTTKLLFYLN